MHHFPVWQSPVLFTARMFSVAMVPLALVVVGFADPEIAAPTRNGSPDPQVIKELMDRANMPSVSLAVTNEQVRLTSPCGCTRAYQAPI